jgi:glycerophosphoryl diester phosphodiesterase
MSIQDKWAWCCKCQALSFTGSPTLGPCPGGGSHSHVGSSNYALVDNDPIVPGQDHWRWCHRCQVLAFAGGSALGACQAGGQHDHAGSGNYTLVSTGNGGKGQANWRWCAKCQAITFAGSATPGACAGGGVHDHTGSNDYVLANAFEDSPANRAALEFAQRSLGGNRNFGPTPLYILGHNTNTKAEILAALSQGANGLEIDVTAYSRRPNELCIGHIGIMGNGAADDDAPSLGSFLAMVHDIAVSHPALAMVMLDVKPPASAPQHGQVLLDAVRTHLTQDLQMNIVFSVSDVTSEHPDRLNGTSIFDTLHAKLGPREGCMLDGDSNFNGVRGYFDGLPLGRWGYGNGTSFGLSDQGATNYRTPIEQACATREAHGQPNFVDAWTINSVDNLLIYLRLGINAMICDADGIARTKQMLALPEFAPRYRLAGRFDNPQAPDRFGYALIVKTLDDGGAGTDANITFTLTGANGSASSVVDTNYDARMESGQTNFVVLFSRDLGALQSVTVQSDQTGNGSRWDLATITVESFRYGGPHKTATFNLPIGTTAPVTRPLV